MDPWVAVVVVVVAAAALAWWLLRRRRAEPLEEEWTLPPTTGEGRPAGGVDLHRQVLDRDALVNPDRRLDPSRWDNSPDGGEDGGDDLPRFLDRDYLASREERTTAPDDDGTDGTRA